MVVTYRGATTQAQLSIDGVVGRPNPRHTDRQAEGVAGQEAIANRNQGRAQPTAIAITEHQVGIERQRRIAFPVWGRSIGQGSQHRHIIDAIDQ